jgi:transposase
VGGFVLGDSRVAAPHPHDKVERVRVLVTTTTRSDRYIAAETKVSRATIREWIVKHGWERPFGAKRTSKLPPEKREAARRVYENRATVDDLAALLGCHKSYIFVFAKKHRWAGRAAAAAPRQKRDDIAALEAALRDPAVTRAEVMRHLERAIALAAADALAGEAGAERQVVMLGKLAGLIKNLPDAAAPLAHKDSNALDHFPDANDLIEEIARRFEEFCAAEEAAALSADAAGSPA